MINSLSKLCILLLMTAVLFGCSSSETAPVSVPSTTSQLQTTDREQGSTTSEPAQFDPSIDGLSFANFSGGTGPSRIQIDDLTDMFGVDGMCVSITADGCAPYPGVQMFLDRLNEVLDNGVCYGISSTTSNYFAGRIQIEGTGKETKDLIEMTRSAEVERVIARLHVMQYSEEYRLVLDRYLDMNPWQVAQQLKTDLSRSSNGTGSRFAIALYSKHGGHAVTPLQIEATDTGLRVSVYDSNWPLQTRWVNFNESAKTWSYQAVQEDSSSVEDVWKGEGKGSIALIPHGLPSDKFDCFFCESTSGSISRSTGSILLVDSDDLQNTGLIITSESEIIAQWSTLEQSRGSEGVKIYPLPSDSPSGRTGTGALMVFVPDSIKDFSLELSQSIEGLEPTKFSVLAVGSTIPTTSLQGKLEKPVEGSLPDPVLSITTEPAISTTVVAVDSSQVKKIQSAAGVSTTMVEPAPTEDYRAITKNGTLEDVVLLEQFTGTPIMSMKQVLGDVDTPFHPIDIGNGTVFSKFLDGSIRLESPTEQIITKTPGQGYGITFPDGGHASFEIEEDGSMVGIFSDGSSTIRFPTQASIHSNADGWVIEESIDGSLNVFLEMTDGVFGEPSAASISEATSIAAELKEVMASVISSENSSQGATPVVDKEQLEEQLEIMSEKYDMLRKAKARMAKMMPEGFSPTEIFTRFAQSGQRPPSPSAQSEPSPSARIAPESPGQKEDQKQDSDNSQRNSNAAPENSSMPSPSTPIPIEGVQTPGTSPVFPDNKVPNKDFSGFEGQPSSPSPGAFNPSDFQSMFPKP